jgi:hypothetical protein
MNSPYLIIFLYFIFGLFLKWGVIVSLCFLA